VEYRLRHADGSWRLVEAIASNQLDNPDIAGIVVNAHDITERKRAEDAVRLAKEEAEQANRAKSAFLSRMSHELRTPLNAIIGFGQVLELDALDPGQEKAVAHILKAGRHLLKLINEILEISRIEAGRLDLSLEPVKLSEVIEEAHGLLLPLIQARSVTVERSPAGSSGCYMRADRQRLTQVVINLLSNAVKYNVTGGTVTLSCGEEAPGRLRLSVTDTGAGIPVEKQTRLFTPFDRLDAERTGIEGTGMGLALTKRLVEAMGGVIGMRSTAGQGSTFWFELDRAAAAEVPPAHSNGMSSAETATAVTRTILYIEDNLSNVQLIDSLVAREPGTRLLSAMQGGQGLDLALAHLPDLILLDVHLPDIPGDEVLRRLQSNPATRRIPVVIISADATRQQQVRLLAAGAKAYLTKPIDIRQFRDTVDAITRHSAEQPAALMS
jgi:signal transduction histidine kinase/CheY-like chemotaxis protein